MELKKWILGLVSEPEKIILILKGIQCKLVYLKRYTQQVSTYLYHR